MLGDRAPHFVVQVSAQKIPVPTMVFEKGDFMNDYPLLITSCIFIAVGLFWCFLGVGLKSLVLLGIGVASLALFFFKKNRSKNK